MNLHLLPIYPLRVKVCKYQIWQMLTCFLIDFDLTLYMKNTIFSFQPVNSGPKSELQRKLLSKTCFQKYQSLHRWTRSHNKKMLYCYYWYTLLNDRFTCIA